MEAHVKTIGARGQISLGKEYAGIKTARIILDSEMWMHEEPAKSRIEKGIKWAEKHKARETDIEALSEKIG